MPTRIGFSSEVLNVVAQAIVGDGKIDAKEAARITKTAVKKVSTSAVPEQDAKEVLNAAQVAIQFAFKGGADARAKGVLSKLEAQIQAAKDARCQELEPKFSPAEYKQAAKVLGAVLREHIASDSTCPEGWRDGAFCYTDATRKSVRVVYDYEFLAGCDDEHAEVEKFMKYVRSLIAKEPGLAKYKGIELEAFGPN